MEPVAGLHFEKGALYARAQIRAALGGSPRAALVTRGGSVVCACLTRRRNPRAPEEIVIGGSAGAVRLARAFAASGVAVPVFVRAPRGGWEYTGERRVRSRIEEPGALLALLAEGAPPDASLALLLEEAAGGQPAAGAATAPAAPAAPGA